MKIVNLKHDKCTVYCGRKKNSIQHFGNPFSHIYGCGEKIVESREKAVEYHEHWLLGLDFKDFCQEQRKWIIENIRSIQEEDVLGCWCAPALCHCSVIIKVLNNRLLNS